jgi:hypothetical protein
MIYTREDLYLRGYIAVDFGTRRRCGKQVSRKIQLHAKIRRATRGNFRKHSSLWQPRTPPLVLARRTMSFVPKRLMSKHNQGWDCGLIMLESEPMKVIGNFSFFGSLWMLVWTTVPRCRVSASAARAGVSDFATKVHKCGLLVQRWRR